MLICLINVDVNVNWLKKKKYYNAQIYAFYARMSINVITLRSINKEKS